MRSGLLLIPLLLIPAAAIAVGTAGPAGAGVSAIAGLVLAALMLTLVRGEEAEVRQAAGARGNADARFLTLLVLGAFVLRATIAVLLRELNLNMALGGDEGTFDANARVFHAWLQGRLPEPFQEKWRDSSQVGYFVLVGTLYWVFGIVQIVPVLVNCLAGALTAIPVYRMTARLAGGLAGRAAAVLVVVFPSLVLWSSLLVRDALAFFCIAWVASLGQDLLRRPSLPRALLLVGALALLATLRTYMFLLLAGALVVAFLVSAMRRPGRAFAVAIAATLGVLVLVRGAGLGEEFVGLDYLTRIDEQRRLNALVGNTAIDIGAHDLSTPTGALTYLPIGIAYFLLAPFPWQMGGRQVLALPDIALWYMCLPLVVSGAIWAFRHRRAASLAPLVAGISICLLYALVEGNVGIIVRHRAQALVLLLPFAGVQIARLMRRRRRRSADEAELIERTRRRRLVGSPEPA
jgi:hypothetical protein